MICNFKCNQGCRKFQFSVSFNKQFIDFAHINPLIPIFQPDSSITIFDVPHVVLSKFESVGNCHKKGRNMAQLLKWGSELRSAFMFLAKVFFSSRVQMRGKKLRRGWLEIFYDIADIFRSSLSYLKRKVLNYKTNKILY